MRYLLDTCVVSELVRQTPSEKVVKWVQAREESSLFLSVLTFGELQKGIAKLADTKRRRLLEDWVNVDLSRRFTGRVLDVDLETAVRWGEISGISEVRGVKVPVVDGLLAATALSHGLTVVTRDTTHLRAAGVHVLDPWTL